MVCNNKRKKNNQQDSNTSPYSGGQEQKRDVLFNSVHADKCPEIETVDGCKGIGAKGRGVLCDYFGQTKAQQSKNV